MSGQFTRRSAIGLGLATASMLGGCSFYDGIAPRGPFYDGTVQRGYAADPQLLAQLKPGISKEQALRIMGSPSTTSTVGGDAWYYISQTLERRLAFMRAKVVEQRVIALYFKGDRLDRVANYGLEDGKVFDYVTRTTVTAGGDVTFLQNMLTNLLKTSD